MEAKEIVRLVNQVREAHGLQALSENSLLQTAAEKKTLDMKQNNYFAHQDASGKTISSLVPQEYHYYAMGENLASGFTSETATVDAWMKSPTHKANLLDQEYRDTAVSIRSVSGKELVAQVFGVQQQEYLSSKSTASIVGSTPVAEVTFYASTALFILVLLWSVLRKQRK